MATLAEVRLWGSRIGAVLLEDGDDIATFEYDADFARSGIQVAPLRMPLARTRYRFPGLNRETFHGLPGLVADSLPDKYGHALINAWLAGQGRSPDSFNAVERLSYVGTRGMGALEYAPVLGPRFSRSEEVHIDALVELASDVLTQRTDLTVSLADDDAMREILSVGTSAGGARAKAIIAWNPETNEVRSGQVDAGEGFQYWLLKFDGVENNKDRDQLADPQGYGAIESGYAQMAKDAGVAMAESRLLEEGGRRHFMTRRFDRDERGGKLHMQSLGALAHFDFNQPGAYSYEQAFQVVRELELPQESVEQIFRRMVFNVVARNQDDHVKNTAFLMDRAGRWTLAPAFDLTYAYRPESPWVSRHQMSVNGKRDDFTLEDFRAAGRVATLKRGRAEAIVGEITEVVSRWPEYAAAAGVPEEQAERVERVLRLDLR